MGYDASIDKSYGGVVYNTMMALICRMFWFTKNENGMENERADHRRPPLVKTTVKVLQDRPRRTINVRPNAGSSYKKRSHKLYKILVEMKKGNSLVVRQLHEMSGENELMRNRLVHLENSRVARATVASDNAKLFEKLNGFVEILSRTTTPTNDDVKIDSTCRCDDGSHNDTTVYEGFDKKLEKLQMTMDDQESLLRLNWNTNGEIDGDGHGKKEPNSDYRSSKSDFYQMRYEMQSLREDVARNTTCIRKSLQDVVETMTAERNARDSQQSTYVETVYSNPPPQVHSRPRPPVISTRPQTVISTRPQTVISTSPPPPMTTVPRPPTPPPATILPPPPPPATILPPPPPPLARTLKKVFRQIDITVEELQAVPLRTPDGKPNIIKIRHSDR